MTLLEGVGASSSGDVRAALDETSSRAKELGKLKSKKELAEKELGDWRAKNADALNVPETESSGSVSPERLEGLRAQRDALVQSLAQAQEQRANTLRGLEVLLAARQEICLLSKKKQVSASKLFTIQKTSEHLDMARRGLDNRYLGDLSNRFDDYANAWLEDEDIDATIDSDFGVRLHDGGNSHDVAGYSSGYQDLLDVCFRMALVDTIFQAERPFIIMDDPFTALDEAKLARAFTLLQTLSERFQIIYFTCHSSRADLAAGVGATKFALPEQHAQRELPRARAEREARERAQAQADLVASYKVCPVTSGRASIALKNVGRTISSNLFSLTFERDSSVFGNKDNTFEVHFIDEKGRAICDRQAIEVLDGQVVPDQLRFSLSTKEDSGSTYELIVHEEGRDPSELVARVPFSAQVAFATEYFDF